MAENNTILEKLEGLVARFEEVSTLITDPNVIGDQKRYVKLTKEYKELGDIMAARKEYLQCLNGLEEAKMMMAENDPEMKEMAREEAAACEARIPQLEEEIKLLLVLQGGAAGVYNKNNHRGISPFLMLQRHHPKDADAGTGILSFPILL